MAAPGKSAAARREAARQEAQRRARSSLRTGVLGIAVLFLSGVGVLVLPDYVFAFIGTMAVGILLILAAFLMVRGSVLAFKDEDEARIY